ncbi:MAG: hypothetical protein HY736_13380 [Verrucomicrobia bacterium]|nr:hypothetical protein [Verrucomicrobiota bacterium]
MSTFIATVVTPTIGSVSPATFTAGVASADITPDPKMKNWVRRQPYGALSDPLFARAVVLSDGITKIVLLAWDLLDAKEFAVARVRTAISKVTGIPGNHVIVHASHNHSGPQSEMGPGPSPEVDMRTSWPTQQDPLYRAWADRVVQTCVDLVAKADAARQPATLAVGRAFVGEWMFNRRPIKPDNAVDSMASPADPYVLGKELRFGTVDPTMTVLSLRAVDGKGIATLFHAPIHAVSIYPTYPGISADWPGAVVRRLRESPSGEPIFLQGCAGDIVPARRGFEAVKAMSQLIAERVVAAQKVGAQLETGPLRTSRALIGIPATAAASRELGRDSIEAEVQVVSLGASAIVTLPGEPLLELGTAIQHRSPFPHTLVLGYANGRGIGYVGLPGGKIKGGYEMSEDVGLGADEAGGFLVETAVRLLEEHAVASKR